MKVSYNWLSTYFDKKLPEAEKLGALLNAHAFELEGMEKVGVDVVLDLKILPDRAHYALCHKGIAREASVVTKIPLTSTPPVSVKRSNTVKKVDVKVDDPKLCRRYMACRIDGVSVKKSSAGIVTALESIGARAINNIVDATNFVMFDVGQPLHAFDADKVVGGIHVRLAKEGETMTLLDGREVVLKASDLLIADEKGPLAIAGVKGGKRAEVVENTRNIIIESANFGPTGVRRTSTRLNLRNDSSKRFESDITPHLAHEAMEKVVSLILEHAGGVAGSVTDIYPNPAKPWDVTISAAQISSMIGVTVSTDEAQDILKREGCVVSITKDTLTITPPLERLDIAIPEDVADEIARIKGYENLPSVDTPSLTENVPMDTTFYWTEYIKNILVEQGFSEVQTYSLVPKGAFEISYPLAADKAALREKLAPKVFESLAMNARNVDLLGLGAIKIFEIGKVFPKTGEKTSIAIGVAQVRKIKGVTSESLLKEALVLFEEKSGAKLEVKFESKGGYAVAEGDIVAREGGAVSKLLGVISELNFIPLSRDIRYKSFSQYPFITRDIAFFVLSGTRADEVAVTIRKAATDAAGDLLVKGPDLFDQFEKEGKLSLAFRMIFQSFERTLSDEEVNVFMTKIYEAAKSKGWQVR